MIGFNAEKEFLQVWEENPVRPELRFKLLPEPLAMSLILTIPDNR